MRHRVAGRKLSRTSSHRVALRRNLVSSLFEHETISTTVEKAKEVKPFAERLITLAKKGTLHARRRAISQLGNRAIVAIEDGEPVKKGTVVGEAAAAGEEKADAGKGPSNEEPMSEEEAVSSKDVVVVGGVLGQAAEKGNAVGGAGEEGELKMDCCWSGMCCGVWCGTVPSFSRILTPSLFVVFVFFVVVKLL